MLVVRLLYEGKTRWPRDATPLLRAWLFRVMCRLGGVSAGQDYRRTVRAGPPGIVLALLYCWFALEVGLLIRDGRGDVPRASFRRLLE